MGLRKKTGIAKKHFYDHYQQTTESAYGDVLMKLEEGGLLVNEEERIYLTSRGTFLGNNVFGRFLFEK